MSIPSFLRQTVGSRRAVLGLAACVFVIPFVHAEDGYRLWLRYERMND